MGLGHGLLDPTTEAKLIASEPRMDLEFTDPLRASTVTISFAAYKMAAKIDADIPIPRRMYFTYKFFTFPITRTGIVSLYDKSSSDEKAPL